jgi:cyclopropane fatty-acyl-phospholipid synthase-like methyltransferase
MTRLSSPSALRNRGPIADVLATILPPEGLVLEIASGSGEHVAFFAERFTHLTFQPTEAAPEALASIDAHCEGLPNVQPAVPLDVLGPWPVKHAHAVVCINMIHASVPETVPALMKGASSILKTGGVMLTYGAYKIGGAHTAPSNESFDGWLKTERDPRFGVRDLEAVTAEANAAGLDLEAQLTMPANNFALVWRRR